MDQVEVGVLKDPSLPSLSPSEAQSESCLQLHDTVLSLSRQCMRRWFTFLLLFTKLDIDADSTFRLWQER